MFHRVRVFAFFSGLACVSAYGCSPSTKPPGGVMEAPSDLPGEEIKVPATSKAPAMSGGLSESPAEPITELLGMEFSEVPGGYVENGTLNVQQIRQRQDEFEKTKNEDEFTRVLLNEPEVTKHYIAAPRYFMARTEVTVAQFRQFVKATGYKTTAERAGSDKTWVTRAASESDRHPVTYVTWDDAQAFCQWLSKSKSGLYRLPTEVEWEWACRPGWKREDGSDNLRDLGKRANVPSLELVDIDPVQAKALTLTHRDGFSAAAPVKSFLPNDLGLYDMVGNVAEWTATRYTGPYNFADMMTTDQVLKDNNNDMIKKDVRCVRGGSWWGGRAHGQGLNRTGFVGASGHSYRYRDNWFVDVGFRVLWDNRPNAAAPDDDLIYSEIDRRIIALVNACVKDQAVEQMTEFKQLVGQRERAAARLAYALCTLWRLPDQRPVKAAEAVLLEMGPDALPAIQQTQERWMRYRADTFQAAAYNFGFERKAREDRAWFPIPQNSQPLSRPLLQEVATLDARLERFRDLEQRIRGYVKDRK